MHQMSHRESGSCKVGMIYINLSHESINMLPPTAFEAAILAGDKEKTPIVGEVIELS